MPRKNMGMNDFTWLIAVIMGKHGLLADDWAKSHLIKYVRPHFDTRTGGFYGITLEGFRGKKEFFIVNENKDKDLYAWVMDFLEKDPKEAGWEDPHKKE